MHYSTPCLLPHGRITGHKTHKVSKKCFLFITCALNYGNNTISVLTLVFLLHIHEVLYKLCPPQLLCTLKELLILFFRLKEEVEW